MSKCVKKNGFIQINIVVRDIETAAETRILDNVDELYVALTGDQCALTNIRITRGGENARES